MAYAGDLRAGGATCRRPSRYNLYILARRTLLTGLLVLTSASFLLSASAASAPFRVPEAQMVVVMPFENESRAPGLEWIGEAFPEVIGQRLSSPSLFVVGRDDRLYAFDRVGIAANIKPSRATLYRIADEMDMDYAVLGSYTYNGHTFSASAQLLDVKKLRLLPEVGESGSLLNILEVQNALAWDLLRQVRPMEITSKNGFVAASPEVRLDAFENYIRGITAGVRQEKISRFREAVRLNPAYSLAIFQLGKTYFAAREYENAASWLARVPRSDELAGEASFYQGLALYYLGQFDKAEAAFTFLASHLPLTEVYNNLGVVAGRRGKRNAVEYFQKAVLADPNDPDYHFNLAVALNRAGDSAGAARHLRDALALRPGDSEAKSLMEMTTGSARSDAAKTSLERIKRNYDETSFRQLALEIQNATEMRLSQTDPATHARYHVERGRQLLNEGFTNEAEKQFREAVLLDPANAATHAGLAASLESGADIKAARAEAATAVRLQPSPEAYLLMARLDLRDNNAQSASENVDRALALEPANSSAQALKREIAAKLAGKPPQ
jgi:tetratricopeptide (TPR) repeat protein